jgi:hypothetical protein
VMHTGQPIGLQVRTRVPSYQPTPELPVTKKLAKLFGRTGRKPDANRPLTAAEELEQLRRELGSKRVIAVEEPAVEAPIAPRVTTRSAAAAVSTTDGAAEAPERVESTHREPITSSFRNHERVAAAFARTAEPEPHLPQAPRRSFREVLGERWAIASPRLQAVTVHLRSFGGRGADHAIAHLQTARELYSRYAVTAAAAAGVVILLCGSFYAGKLLFNRPAVTLTSGDASSIADSQVRPDVLDISNTNARSNEAVANVSGAQTETKLERNAGRTSEGTTPAKSGAFGGRRLDLNYVIMQSYFTQAEAEATVEVLNKYGIKATVETNLPRWAMAGKNLYSVVSVEGFAKMTGNSDFQAFMTSVNKINDKEAGNTLPKKLDPRPYRIQPQS